MPNNYLRVWRQYRGLTQAQLAEAIGTTAPVVSLLECGDRQLAPKWLRRLARVLNAPTGAFLEYGPDDERAALFAAWAAIPAAERPIVLEIVRTLALHSVQPARGATETS